MGLASGVHSSERTYKLVQEDDFASLVVDVGLHVAAANPAHGENGDWSE